jgi:hydroxymethylglutaryl-CoA lyase
MPNSPLSGLPQRVTVVEVGPRDGLQNEHGVVATADKIRFIDLLSEAGFPVIEATSFVSPKAIPALADADRVFPAIRKRPGTRYPVLVPNLRGLERALAAGVRAIALFTAASETFTQRNINMTIEQSLTVFAAVIERAKPAGLWVRGYVSTAFGCPYEGAVPPARVLAVTERLFALGCEEVSIGDTIGVATPNQVTEMVGLLAGVAPLDQIALHLHDTRGTALANAYAGLERGVTCFDSAAGGLGGCPYAPGASGNLATEDLLYMLHGLGIETGVDLEKVVAASQFLARVLRHDLPSRYLAAATATMKPAAG